MKKIMAASLLTLALISVISAQTNRPPSPKDPPTVKIFESVEGGFKIRFPATPKREVKMVPGGAGEAPMTTYSHGGVSTHYLAAYVDFPAAIESEEEIELRFDMIGQGLAARPGSKVIEQRRVIVNDSPGREFVFENQGFTMTLRCVIIRQRVFQLGVTTRGLISKSQAARKLHEDKAGAFFESFEVTTIPSPKLEGVDLPENFDVTFKDQQLQIGFFGVLFRLPDSWEVTADGFNEMLVEGLNEETQAMSPKDSKALRLSLSNTRVLASFSRVEGDDVGFMLFAAERISIPNFVPSAFITGVIKTNLEPGEKVIKRVDKEMIGGVEFAWVETKKPDSPATTRMYAANRRGIAFQIAVTFTTQKHLNEALSAIKAIKFSEIQAEKK